MSQIKRRHFLQFAGSAMAALGLNQLDLQNQSLRYAKVLAENTPRKLALLVGINQYPQYQQASQLRGCLNDVELQRQLLIHRFGFNNQDIKILTDGQATRDRLLQAFEEHLINQAKPGDVVVFHYSGHGSQVYDPDCDFQNNKGECLNSTFVTFDDNPNAQPDVVNQIMGHTLFLLMSALKQKTENVTAILDSCHSGGGTRANIKIRSVRGGADFKINPVEFEYQEKWLERLNLSKEQFITRRKQGIPTGVVIAAAQRHQYAADYEFADFFAGAFTYLLTQYLWQKADSVDNAIAVVKNRIKAIEQQQDPLIEAMPNSGNENKPCYFIPQQVPPAEAVIISTNGNQAKLWLGGIAGDSINAFGVGATLIPVATTRAETTEIELIKREGLLGEAIVKGTVKPGDLLQEFARVIPTDWQLQIGLDPSLGAETTEAKQTIETLSRIQAVPAQTANRPYPKEVHYILSRMTATYRQQLPNSTAAGNGLPPEESIGLFAPNLEVIPKSFGQPGETVKAAISRLQSQLKSLLAARIVKMTLNAESSRLNLGVTMTLESQPNKLIGEVFTVRSCRELDGCDKGSRGSKALPVKSNFQFQVTNREKIPLYLGILLIDAEGINVLFPNEFQRSGEDAKKATLIQPNQTLLIPDHNKDEFVLATEEAGRGEVLVIASQKPLTESFLRLQSIAKKRGARRGVLGVRGDDAIAVVNDMISDISRGIAVVKARQKLPVAELAALALNFEVI